MPSRPMRPCLAPGCGRLVPSGWCDEHRKNANRDRGTSCERGYDARWQKARLHYLRQHPLCVECERRGETTAATVVDHVVPHRGNQDLFWDDANWQSLCKACHDAKTRRGE